MARSVRKNRRGQKFQAGFEWQGVRTSSGHTCPMETSLRHDSKSIAEFENPGFEKLTILPVAR